VLPGVDQSFHALQGRSVSEILLGLWHGFVAPVTLLCGIDNEVWPGFFPWMLQMYEKQSYGGLCDAGFRVGLFAAPSFLTAGVSARRRFTRCA